MNAPLQDGVNGVIDAILISPNLKLSENFEEKKYFCSFTYKPQNMADMHFDPASGRRVSETLYRPHVARHAPKSRHHIGTVVGQGSGSTRSPQTTFTGRYLLIVLSVF